MEFELAEFFAETNNAGSLDDLVSCTEKHLRCLGVQAFLYSLLTPHISYRLPNAHGIIRSYSEDWMNHYVEKRYDLLDPVKLQTLVSATPFGWKELNEIRDLTPSQKRMMNEAGEAGLKHGFGKSVFNGVNEVAGFGFTSDTDLELTPERKILFSIICQQFSHSFLRIMSGLDQTLPAQSLFPRELEVLKWAACGKTNLEVADIMTLSVETVKGYLKSIHRKLETTTRMHAVVKAIAIGLIDIPSDYSGLR